VVISFLFYNNKTLREWHQSRLYTVIFFFFFKNYIPRAFYFTIGFPCLISHIIVRMLWKFGAIVLPYIQSIYYIRTYVVLFIVIVFALKVVHSGYRFFTVFSIHFVIIYSANNIYYDNNNKAIELKKIIIKNKTGCL